MRVQKQKFMHDPANGVWGDCHRTVIACILDLDASEVPHFADEDNADWERDCEAWLNARGLTAISIAYPGELDLKDIFEMIDAFNKGIAFILGGKSKLGSGHSVVCQSGNIVCDPSIVDSGIVGPMSDGFYWVTFIGSSIAKAA